MQRRRSIFRVDPAGAPSALGPLEARVMEVVWSLGGWVSVNDVIGGLRYKAGEKPLAYTTVKTVLSNLAEKRRLKKRAAGKANVFQAMQTRDDFQKSVIGDLVGPLLRTQRNPLLAHLAGELAADDETYAEFERLLTQKRAQLQDD